MEKNIHFSSIDTLDMYKEAIFKNQNTNRSTNGIFSFKRFSWIFRTCLILSFCIYGEQICVAKSKIVGGSSTKTEVGGGNAGGGKNNYNNTNPIDVILVDGGENTTPFKPDENNNANTKPSKTEPEENKTKSDDVIIHATPESSSLTESKDNYNSSLLSKCQTGFIDYNSYYYSAGNPGGQWMSRLAKLYDGRTDEEVKKGLKGENGNKTVVGYYPDTEFIKGLRRGIVPSAMVDSKGDLYTLSLWGFGESGPEFQLKQYHYEKGEVKEKSVKFYPWKLAYDDSALELPVEPKLDSETDKKLFNWCFHNALSPCLFKETEDYDDFLRIFCPIPNQKYITGTSGVEGGLFLKYSKVSLSSTATPSTFKMYKNSDEERFAMNRMPSRRYGNNAYAFQNCWGNYQGIIAEYPGNKSYHNWLFFLALSKSGNFDTCEAYYKKIWSAGFTNESGGKVTLSPNYDTENDTSDKDTRKYICPRFIRVGSYIYYAILHWGYWMSFGRMDINGNMKSLGNHISDVYLETTKQAISASAYNFDYCILNKDGTPCTKSSPDDTDENNRKILCVFSLGGGGDSMGMTVDFGWEKTYINWTYNWVCGIISSVLLPKNGGSIMATYSAYVHNAIYVTNIARSGGNCVSITNTEKSDLYRLYLNSHKIVPYTSPSGKHYMIYAYCYPGKKEHLYLGYAQYFIDSDYQVRLLSQTEFRDASGNSFGNFTHCSRIISMDLRGNHLWITFVKDTGWDATGQSTDVKQKAGCYYYFHILASDLIQE